MNISKKFLVLFTLFFLFSSNITFADPNADLRSAYQRKDYRTVFRIASEFAKKGDPAGEYILGELYSQGTGVKKNLWTAGQWYKKAAAKNHPLAMYALGLMYATGQGAKKNLWTAGQWYKKAAAQNHPIAMYALGSMHATGQGAKKTLN